VALVSIGNIVQTYAKLLRSRVWRSSVWREGLLIRDEGIAVGAMVSLDTVGAGAAEAVADADRDRHPGEDPELTHPASDPEAPVENEPAADFDGSTPGALLEHRERAREASPGREVAREDRLRAPGEARKATGNGSASLWALLRKHALGLPSPAGIPLMGNAGRAISRRSHVKILGKTKLQLS
jgi:hypothetical protein